MVFNTTNRTIGDSTNEVMCIAKVLWMESVDGRLLSTGILHCKYIVDITVSAMVWSTIDIWSGRFDSNRCSIQLIQNNQDTTKQQNPMHTVPNTQLTQTPMHKTTKPDAYSIKHKNRCIKQQKPMHKTQNPMHKTQNAMHAPILSHIAQTPMHITNPMHKNQIVCTDAITKYLTNRCV